MYTRGLHQADKQQNAIMKLYVPGGSMRTVGVFVGLFGDSRILLVVPVAALYVSTPDLRWCTLPDLGPTLRTSILRRFCLRYSRCSLDTAQRVQLISLMWLEDGIISFLSNTFVPGTGFRHITTSNLPQAYVTPREGEPPTVGVRTIPCLPTT